MIFYILDASQSAYIFRQQFLISLIIAALTIGLILFFLFRINKAKPDGHRPYKPVYKNLFFIAIAVVIYLVCFFPLLRNTLGLKNRGIETEGKTLKWVDIGDGQRNIEYAFEINGTTFIKQGEVVYGGKEIEGIICPGGRYVVIYDKSNPENSVIDLKRRVFQPSGHQ